LRTCFRSALRERVFSAEPRSSAPRPPPWHIACSSVRRGHHGKTAVWARSTRREEQGDESSFNVSLCNHGRSRGAERGGSRGTRGGAGATASASVRNGAQHGSEADIAQHESGGEAQAGSGRGNCEESGPGRSNGGHLFGALRHDGPSTRSESSGQRFSWMAGRPRSRTSRRAPRSRPRTRRRPARMSPRRSRSFPPSARMRALRPRHAQERSSSGAVAAVNSDAGAARRTAAPAGDVRPRRLP
jgi:hypothetical protein